MREGVSFREAIAARPNLVEGTAAPADKFMLYQNKKTLFRF
jgi:hypothetical protein